MPNNTPHGKYSLKPFEVSRAQILACNCRLAPSSQRDLAKIPGSPLSAHVDSMFNGKELGTALYVSKSKNRFIRTGNITSKALVDCSEVEYCKPNTTPTLKGGEILIAEDGGGDGLGETCLYEKISGFVDHLCNGALALVVKNEDSKHYVLGFLKSQYFKEYLDNNTPVASTLRHSNGAAKDFVFPLYDSANPIHVLLSLLTANVVDKERNIAERNTAIDSRISTLLGIGKHGAIEASRDLLIKNDFRFSASLYSQEFLDIYQSILAYPSGYFPLLSRYDSRRGQNLQISNVGQSYYSSKPKKGFYRLVTTMELSDLRTIATYRFLGNSKQLSIVPTGAIMLSADGTVGKSIYVVESHFISNIHQWVLTPKSASTPDYERIYVSCFFQWLRNKGYFEYIKDKANGGGIKEPHLKKFLNIPNIPTADQINISSLYSNQVGKTTNTLSDYLANEKKRNSESGIWQLNMECFELRAKIEKLVEKIVFNRRVFIPFYLT